MHSRTFDYETLVEIYKDIKDNVADKTLEERLEIFKQYDHDQNGFIERVSFCLFFHLLHIKF